MKLKPYSSSTEHGFVFYCPACRERHFFRMGASDPALHIWSFNGDVSFPTFTPSLHIFSSPGKYVNNKWVETGPRTTRCHLTLTDGDLTFHDDCPHRYAGQTVPLEDLPLVH